MGYGDWIMATAQAKQMQLANGRPVYVVGRGSRPMWSEVFENNPRIVRRPTPDSQILVNGSGVRPYIRTKTEIRWVWKRWNIEPGEIYLTDEERLFGSRYGGRILIEPQTKVPRGNKAWPWQRWQATVNVLSPWLDFVQVAPTGEGPWLDGVERVITNTFRQACAVLASSVGFVGCEGGLHHAAAALGIQAVVLYSEFIGPEITGYNSQRNIRHANGMCGARLPCEGCRLSMEAITVDEVAQAVREVT